MGFRIHKGDQAKGATGLSKRRKLMITYDAPSNSILVANASPSQTEGDRAADRRVRSAGPQDSVEIRQTASIKMEYSKASIIAAAVKEVYRDLLSSRDKEFDRGGDERQQGRRRGASDGDQLRRRPRAATMTTRRSPMKVGFRGCAVDRGRRYFEHDSGFGAEGDLRRRRAMIKELDEEAAPTDRRSRCIASTAA